MKKTIFEILSFLAASAVFFYLRAPYVKFWWIDFNADYAMFGLMAKHTMEGHFPIFFYGQNYLGGLEWLTTAIVAKVVGATFISPEILCWNSIAWWFAAACLWLWALRRWNKFSAHLFFWFMAFASPAVLRASVLQEEAGAAMFLFFGALLLHLLATERVLLGRWGAFVGAILGLAWWSNQSVIFFFLPAFVLFQWIPHGFWQNKVLREFTRPEKALTPLYILAAILSFGGLVIAIMGGLNCVVFHIHLKIPNGATMLRNALTVLLVLQFLFKIFSWKKRNDSFASLVEVAKRIMPFFLGFLLGYAPVWLGKPLHWYEKSYGIGLGINPYWNWVYQSKSLFAGSLPELLYAVPVGLLFLLLAGIAAFAWYLHKNKKIVLFACSAFFLNLAYVWASDRSLGAPIRYLYPAYLCPLLLWSVVSGSKHSSAWKGLGFGSLLILAALSLHGRRLFLQQSAQLQERRENIEAINLLLETKHLPYCWGDYWTSYLFTFLRNEKTILSPHLSAPDHQVRIRKDAELVAAANPSCFLYRKESAAGALVYFSETNPWVKP